MSFYKPRRVCYEERDLKGPFHLCAHFSHFIDHLYRIFLLLPRELQGSISITHDLADHAEALGLPPEKFHLFNNACHIKNRAKGLSIPKQDGILLGASKRVLRDLIAVHKLKKPVALVEHGCGLTYVGDRNGPRIRQKSFLVPGTQGDIVNLHIVPNKRVGKMYREYYPLSDIAVVGCPKLDKWHTQNGWKLHDPIRVCISTHFDLKRCNETRSAWPWMKHGVKALQDSGYEVITHCHPRGREKYCPEFEEMGLTFLPNFDEVLEYADVYIADCTSTIYEFASTGRPVVCYNAPIYRKHINHGLRFWEDIPGPQCDRPEDMPKAVNEAIEFPSDKRESVLRHVYHKMDGKAAERAVNALVKWRDSAVEYAKQNPDWKRYSNRKQRKGRML